MPISVGPDPLGAYTLSAALLALSLLLPSGVFGQAVPSAGPAAALAITRDAQGYPTVRAHRVGERIVVDGRLGEPFYETASPFDDLIQAVPVSRGAPSERTEVWIGFDDARLYVAARVWDSARRGGVDCERDAPGFDSTPLQRLVRDLPRHLPRPP